MANLSRTRRILFTLLLAVAVTCAWTTGRMSPDQPMPRAHQSALGQGGHLDFPAAAGADAHAAHVHPATQDTRAGPSPGQADAAFCIMTVCHPAVLVVFVGVAGAVANGSPAPAGFWGEDGNEPSPALPPPRMLPV